jgi:hypothetical protein
LDLDLLKSKLISSIGAGSKTIQMRIQMWLPTVLSLDQAERILKVCNCIPTTFLVCTFTVNSHVCNVVETRTKIAYAFTFH